MMVFSYEWKCHPVLYNSTTRLDFQSKGNAAMCLAINQAKEDLSESLGMCGTCSHMLCLSVVRAGVCVCFCVCVAVCMNHQSQSMVL